MPPSSMSCPIKEDVTAIWLLPGLCASAEEPEGVMCPLVAVKAQCWMLQLHSAHASSRVSPVREIQYCIHCKGKNSRNLNSSEAHCQCFTKIVIKSSDAIRRT